MSDLRGVLKLAVQGTAGVTRVVEGVHRSVLDRVGVSGHAEAGRTGGITGAVYRSIEAVTRGVGAGMDRALTALQPLLETSTAADGIESAPRAAVIAALNGVMGDHLLANNSPFATPMTLRLQRKALHPGAMPTADHVSGKILVLVHGLCMNDLQWRSRRDGASHDHGQVLAAALGFTPLYLRYNSGLNVSLNGRALARQLQQLCRHWPVPVTEIAFVTHSMGGLVARSALHCAQEESLDWRLHVSHLAFLGTPHHGAPLERAGNWIDVLLGATPYSAPFAALGQLRSAGITDLRHGNVLDQDWQPHDRFERRPDARTHLPLPSDIACHAIAATTGDNRGLLADHPRGDGLVPVRSALGLHADPQRCLMFAADSQWIAARTGHLQLLGSTEVAGQLITWLTARR